MNSTTRSLASFLLATLVLPMTASADAPNLGGSHISMERQHEAAIAESYNFLDTPAEIRELVSSGKLDSVVENADLELAGVSFPYARAEVRVFLERIAAQYHAAIGERLVVTSLTRPTSLQPSNAHELSVHPAGMAIDFRIPARAKARVWLERTLLAFEREGVLDVTRERTPAHYHVAVYPKEFRAYLEKLTAPVVTLAPSLDAPASATSPSTPGVRNAPVDRAQYASASFALLLLPAGLGLGAVARRRSRRVRVIIPR